MMMIDMTGRADAGHETGTMTSRVALGICFDLQATPADWRTWQTVWLRQ
jgi:hypothetical protein